MGPILVLGCTSDKTGIKPPRQLARSHCSLSREDTQAGISSQAGVDAVGNLALNLAGKVAKSIKNGSKRFILGESGKKAADMTDSIADVDLKREIRDAVNQLLKNLERRLAISIK